jgi:bifunctional non-homologous end joining protein LigD
MGLVYYGMAVLNVKRQQRRPPRSASASGRLKKYRAKRNLVESGEPDDAKAGRAGKKAGAKELRRYVIQKHHATRLHYDFRLEMDGVYRSWAVPKGIPTKPGERNLAIEVEDHPLAYGTFEGTIPEGNYGAGTVMLWDRGYYSVADQSPEASYRAGKIHLALAGDKCVGEWTLVRLRPRGDEKKTQWLLLKNSGPQERAAMTGAERDNSVLTGRSLEEIAEGKKAAGRRPATRIRPPAKGKSAREKKLPARAPGGEAAKFIPPMKALSVEKVPAGDWRLEIKWDGYRAIAVINHGEVELWSRNHKPLTAAYPEVVEALGKMPCSNAVIDGEIVALDAEGRAKFQLLQGRGRGGSRPAIIYYVFDLLHFDGRSLLQHPIEERQMALEVLVGKKTGTVRYSPVIDATPEELLDEARKQGFEGIIAKTAGSVYEPDRRSGAWLKCKIFGEQEFVIGGFTPPKNSREYFGAILVGYYAGKDLMYAGKVGSGFDRRRLESLHRDFLKRRVEKCPFANLPSSRRSRFGTGMTASAMREVTWIRPDLVGQVRFTEWTDDGSLRHPVFLGLRPDKSAKEVVREAGPSADA